MQVSSPCQLDSIRSTIAVGKGDRGIEAAGVARLVQVRHQVSQPANGHGSIGVASCAVNHARSESLGVWSIPDGVAPWDWRRGDRAGSKIAAAAPAATTAVPSAGSAGDQETEERTVYVTKSGAKYHRTGCQYLSKSKIPIPYSQAKGSYGPCSRCKP